MFKMYCSGHNAVLCTYNVLPAGTQLKIPKETEDRTAGSTPFLSIMWSKWTPALELRLVCSQPLRSCTWTWWETRDVSDSWWMDVWDPEQIEIYLSVITFLICPYPMQPENNITSLWKGRMHSELYRSWVMSSGSNGSVGVVLVRFDLSQETMDMFVIFSTQCHPEPLVASRVSTPQSVPASNCHLPGCYKCQGSPGFFKACLCSQQCWMAYQAIFCFYNHFYRDGKECISWFRWEAQEMRTHTHNQNKSHGHSAQLKRGRGCCISESHDSFLSSCLMEKLFFNLIRYSQARINQKIISNQYKCLLW